MRPLPPDGQDEKSIACPPKVYHPDCGREKTARADSDGEKAADKRTDDAVTVTVAETGLTTPASTLCSTPYPEPAYIEKASDGAAAAAVEEMPSRKEPWWSRYSGYRPLKRLPPSRTARRTLLLIGTAAALAIIAILIWLAKSGRLGDRKQTAQITLTQGTYIGEITPKSDTYPRAIEAWRGIPYAQTTGGDNRFRPPQPLPDSLQSATSHDARSFGSICSQGGSVGGEDCLNLNLYRPHFGADAAADAKDMAKLGGAAKKLPIVIYVHGGGFNAGRGMERNMASFVSWAETPTIGISFNYRVGALGFLPSAVTAKEGLLNLGLKDQQMLFAWVQKNAASFGGDPDNVTLMGLSAGSHSIGHQLISYSPANKLTSDAAPFHKAIIESGGATARAVFAPSHPLHEQQFQEFLGECGLSMTPDDQVFAQLRALPLSKIQQASNTIWNRYTRSIRWPFQPTVDGPGGVIPDLPIQSWAKGNVLRIPVLTGFNTNEGALFLPTAVSDSSALRQLMGNIIPALNETSLEVMEAIYPDPLNTTEGRDMYITKPPAGFGKQFWRLDDAYAHYAYICPVLQTGHYVSSFNSSNAGPPVYVYQFAARSQAHGATDHGDEAPVVAHDMQVLSPYPGLTDTADAMTGYWSRFAAYGDPNPTSYTSLPANLSITWEGFKTPFAPSFSPDGNDGGGDSTNDGKGQIALFGSGNNERMLARGPGSIGIPVQMSTLADRVVMECRYWMDRVVYSEGFGNGSLAV